MFDLNNTDDDESETDEGADPLLPPAPPPAAEQEVSPPGADEQQREVAGADEVACVPIPSAEPEAEAKPSNVAIAPSGKRKREAAGDYTRDTRACTALACLHAMP